jgi:hypothetical protein
MTYAIIRNNIVENIIVWDGVTPYTPPEGTILVRTDTAGIGWIYDPATGEFTPPAEPVIEGGVQ